MCQRKRQSIRKIAFELLKVMGRTATSWTPERRARQAEAIRAWRPWERSTGPTSPEGKAISSRNRARDLGFDRTANEQALRYVRHVLGDGPLNDKIMVCLMKRHGRYAGIDEPYPRRPLSLRQWVENERRLDLLIRQLQFRQMTRPPAPEPLTIWSDEIPVPLDTDGYPALDWPSDFSLFDLN